MIMSVPILYEHNGKMRKLRMIMDLTFCRLNEDTVRARVRKGMPMEQALTLPVQRICRRLAHVH